METLVCDPICSRNQSTDVVFEMLEECAEEIASVGESEVLACYQKSRLDVEITHLPASPPWRDLRTTSKTESERAFQFLGLFPLKDSICEVQKETSTLIQSAQKA